ncbi:hypothetical protein [Paraburkholderia sp. J10-1]|uniref:hypothetical protein n=1 Tax=Paraburkholderia sp. J10-1 TaxID=2805430 RepID=UPI002AB713DB|nr:hypothetical protein [Paraburkholderia sp. J10-1]
MKDTPQNMQLAPMCVMSVGTRMVQLGLEELQAALGLQAKCVERDRVAAQHACEALLDARMYDSGALVQTWQTLVREYFAASTALCEQSQDLNARSQAAFGALMREAAVDFEKACVLAQAQTSHPAGALLPAADWMTYLGQFVGLRPNGEAIPAKPASGSVSASA